MQNKIRLTNSLTRNKFNLHFDWWKITFFGILLFVNSSISHFGLKKRETFYDPPDWQIGRLSTIGTSVSNAEWRAFLITLKMAIFDENKFRPRVAETELPVLNQHPKSYWLNVSCSARGAELVLLFFGRGNLNPFAQFGKERECRKTTKKEAEKVRQLICLKKKKLRWTPEVLFWTSFNILNDFKRSHFQIYKNISDL